MGTKRGRVLIRQTRIKRDSETTSLQPSTDVDFLEFGHRAHPKIERHASEPAPTNDIESCTPHFLNVPSTPYLMKQHSYPILLPSQSGSSNSELVSSHYTLHRQLSYPSTTLDAATTMLVPATVSSGSVVSTTGNNMSTSITHLIERTYKTEQVELDETKTTHDISPTIVLVTDPLDQVTEVLPSIRVKGEELQRSMSTPHVNIHIFLLL